MAQEIIYKINVDSGSGEKNLTKLKNEIIQLEKQLLSLQKAGKDTEISFGKPNEFKKTEQALASLKIQLSELSKGASTTNTTFTQVTNGINQTAGAFVGVVGKVAGLNTALNSTNEVLSEQVFAQEALKVSLDASTKSIANETNQLNQLQNAADEPIVLDVKTNKAEIDALLKSSDNAEEQLKVLDSLEVKVDVGSNLDEVGNSFKELDNEVDKERKITLDTATTIQSVASLRKEVLGLQNQLENTEVGTEQYKALELQLVTTSTRLAETTDRTGDLADAVRTQVGSSVERASSSFGLLKDGLANLDFEKINVGLKGIGGAIKNAITPSKAFKDSISTIGKSIVSLDFNGFKAGLSGVSTGFKGLGKAIIATGIGALVVGITTLIANFDELKSSGGAVGKVFTFIGDIISNTTKIVTDFTDAIGLTNVAQEKANEKLISNAQELSKVREDTFNRDIALAKANGKETVELEKQKLNELIRLAAIEFNILKQRKEAGETLSADEKKRLQESTKLILDYQNELNVIAADQVKRSNDVIKAEQDKTKAIVEANAKAVQSAQNNYDLQISIIKKFEEDRIITSEEANEKILQSDLELVKKRLDAYKQLALADNILTEGETNRIIELEKEIKAIETSIQLSKDKAGTIKLIDDAAKEASKQLNALNVGQIEIDIKARLGISDVDFTAEANAIAEKQILLDEQTKKYEALLQIQQDILDLDETSNNYLTERDALLQRALILGIDGTKTLEENVQLQGTSLAYSESEVEISTKNLEAKRELIKLQNEFTKSQQLTVDQETRLAALRNLEAEGGAVGRAATTEIIKIETQLEVGDLEEKRQFVLDQINNLKAQVEQINIKLNIEGITPEEKATLEAEAAQLGNDIATKTAEATAIAQEQFKSENGGVGFIGKLFKVDEEQQAQLIEGALSLANQISDALLANQAANNQRSLDQRLSAISDAESTELALIDNQLKNKNILEEDAAIQRQRIQAKYQAQEEAAKKAAFQRDKKLKLAQATQEYALGLIRLFANSAAKGLVGLLTEQPIAAAILTAGYLTNLATISSQKYEKGGIVPKKYNDGGLAKGPSHKEGGIPFTVNGTPGFEMEGGEYIIKTDAVNKYGRDIFDKLNNLKFQSGGQVPSTASAFVSDNFVSTTEFAQQQLNNITGSPVPLLDNQGSSSVVYVSDINSSQNRLNRTRVRTAYGNA